MGKRRTHDQFIEEMADRPITILGVFIKRKAKIRCECDVCNYIWSPTADALLVGKGCPNCAGHMLKTTEQFIGELEEISPAIEVIGVYINAKTHIGIKCKECGHLWNSQPNNLMSGYGCPSCAGNKKRTDGEFKEIMSTSSIDVLGDYISHMTPILCKCKNCDYSWDISPSNLFGGKGCPSCAGNLKKTHKQFKAEMANISIKIKGKYKTSKHKIKCKCKICGHKWKVTPSKLLVGRGCPSCAVTGFKPDKQAWLYLYNIESEWLGFGITGDLNQRHSRHTATLTKAGVESFKMTHNFHFSSGFDCELLESKLKKKFTITDLGVDGFRREAMSINYLDAVLLEIERFRNERLV